MIHLFPRLTLVATLLAASASAQAPAGAPTTDARPAASRRTQRVVPFPAAQVASPDGRVKFLLAGNAERLTFSVQLGATTVIEPSPLRLLVDGNDLASGVSFRGRKDYAVHEAYPVRGAHRTATDHSQGARFAFTNDLAMTDFTLEVRAGNDGVAYRLIVPGAADAVRTPDEFSEFILPAGATLWFHDLDGHYEAAYQTSLSEDVPAGQWAGPPLTFALPGGAGYGVITEANLVNYSGMALESDGRRGWITGLGHRQPLNYPFELRYGRAEGRRLSAPATITGPITTPWRVVIAGPDLNTLVNSDLLTNLSPPPDRTLFPQGADTPWVTPGLAVWRYTDGGDNTFEGLKQFSLWAGQLGAKYHIVEGIWRQWSDAQIREIVDDSRAQGVGLLFWRHSRELRTPEAREEFFSRLARLGVAGAKIDFIDHEAKESIDLYETLLAGAAAHRLVIDFHGANKPTGRERTWPNDMLREAVRGMEASRFTERARHETILPFTRYLAGPCDYTTMHFGARRGDSTWAHQLAALATFHSPILTIAAHPETVLRHPAADVIKSIPPVWDETIVLPGSRPGALSVFARRSGDRWMLAVMAAGPARTIEVPLTFLGEGAYHATLVQDEPDRPDAVRLDERTARRTDTLTIPLGAGGGFVARFTP